MAGHVAIKLLRKHHDTAGYETAANVTRAGCVIPALRYNRCVNARRVPVLKTFANQILVNRIWFACRVNEFEFPSNLDLMIAAISVISLLIFGSIFR